ncbi:MmgE/PrpD family protein [Bradyrhizobium ganzhouense]|uniref:MmgE/PrpD family protein n=1 Tax=Bradyrhizobium ganzhouense TaxID=1179767 RepID=UPI003CEF5F6B
MNKQFRRSDVESGMTRALAHRIATLRYEDLPADVVAIAKHCILDWVALTVQGAHEPLATILAEQVAAEGGNDSATLIGRSRGASPRQAALVNGAASHALDYDDVNIRMMGHPTAAVLPAALALAESRGASGRDLIAAFVTGYETECEVGELVSPSHYARGFHATGTIGTFGAAAACAHLCRLDPEAVATALGIAGTQAAGLKSMFGTMCKPLHAGKAGESGLLAAELAARGFSSRTDVLECANGFVATHADDGRPVHQFSSSSGKHHIVDNLFKYHACCHQTHAAIEALRALQVEHQFFGSDVVKVTLRHDAGADAICNIARPTTGLEIKFSLRMIAALTLAGIDTALVANFDDANARDPALQALRDKVEVTFARDWPLTRSEVTVQLADGRVLTGVHDSGLPEKDLGRQQTRLLAKFRLLVGPVFDLRRADDIAADILSLEQQADLKHLTSRLVHEQR